ncbi:PIG-L deacetylase family protein [Frigidibacter sp. MR17.14]|uniref:PIG-L deacetylase family protein n=1 Tax=Frigidibacter sp. MR17.14 TaxID=3126509 RepID=UPI003012A3B4
MPDGEKNWNRVFLNGGQADPDSRFAQERGWAALLRDRLVARLRPGWIRDPLRLLLGVQAFERFAPLPWIDLPEGARMAVLAPHPDDESIGPGGLVAAWTAAGRQAEVVLLTEGGAGNPALRDPALDGRARARLVALTRDRRRAEAGRALAALGAAAAWLDGTDGALSGDEPRLAGALAALWRARPPDLVLAPFPADRHADHAATARILVLAARAARLPETLPVLAYEVWSPLPANALFDISAVAARKWQAIAAHESQLASTDYLTAARGLAAYRGAAGGRPVPAEAYHRCTLAAYAAMAEGLRP